MLDPNDTSFLKQSYLDFKTGFDETQLIQFSKLNNDFHRFEFINNMHIIFPVIHIIDNGKNKNEANLLKEKGNNAFQAANYEMALKLYTQSLLKSPKDEGKTYFN